MKKEMKIEIVAEHKVDQGVHKQLYSLLGQSFPDYPERSYYKLLPQFRYLVWAGDKLVAQMGVEHRVINMDGHCVRVFGIIDLCVAPEYRIRKIATTLLRQVEALAQSSDVDFLILFANDHRLYHSNGYDRVVNVCRYVMVNEHQTLGIGERSFEECMMVKPIRHKKWQDGLVDMLGYVF